VKNNPGAVLHRGKNNPGAVFPPDEKNGGKTTTPKFLAEKMTQLSFNPIFINLLQKTFFKTFTPSIFITTFAANITTLFFCWVYFTIFHQTKLRYKITFVKNSKCSGKRKHSNPKKLYLWRYFIHTWPYSLV